jgi:hypothetical protein
MSSDQIAMRDLGSEDLGKLGDVDLVGGIYHAVADPEGDIEDPTAAARAEA